MYEYDDAGRIVASRPEPEWDDVELGWMDALRWYREEYLCPCGCGFPREVSQDPMTEFRVNVPDPVRCHARTALSKRQRDFGGDNPEALLWRVEVNPPGDATP